MPELIGIIAPLRKFLSNNNETIQVQVNGSMKEILSLQKDREYIIPDFQREIRWDKDNISQLIEDIRSGPKYLGNIILTQKIDENKFLIIDGQQRITVLSMILSCLRNLHNGQIETIVPCKLSIESFIGYEKIVENNFPNKNDLNIEILCSDKLNQTNKYYDLWNHIKTMECITNRREASLFIENLEKSNINIILNRSDDLKDGIRYFIDVNLKGKQLDTEDIFKAYLFRKDSGSDIREEWYTLKRNVSRIENTKMKYPLLKLLEHYFFCDLYNDVKFKGLVFDEDFLLKSEFKTHEDNPIKYRARTHIIEVINNNSHMLKSLRKLNKVIDIMINIVANDSINDNFNELFLCLPENNRTVRIDNSELRIIHNFIGKILKDEKILPKALVMKYILSVLINNEPRSKVEYKKIYGVYLLSILFIIFENNKSKDVFMSTLKASNDDWYTETVKQINSYFTPDKITDNKIISQFKQGINEDDEDYRFRCKSLATIYNFFRIEDNKVTISGSLDNVKRFVIDDDFTTEHFIISESRGRAMKIVCNGQEKDYIHVNEVYNKYINSLFNFIFISRDLNNNLKNYWLPQKIQLINPSDLECDYSKMIINNIKNISDNMQKDVDENNFQDNLYLFFVRDFKEQYIEYARNVLNEVIDKIKR